MVARNDNYPELANRRQRKGKGDQGVRTDGSRCPCVSERVSAPMNREQGVRCQVENSDPRGAATPLRVRQKRETLWPAVLRGGWAGSGKALV